MDVEVACVRPVACLNLLLEEISNVFGDCNRHRCNMPGRVAGVKRSFRRMRNIVIKISWRDYGGGFGVGALF
jgi:hypothetical protein